jgi:hypothetical protein
MRNPFLPNSRYHGLELASLEVRSDESVIFLRRRFVPGPERFSLLLEHTVSQSERLDHITAQHLGDATAFWRICDANRAMLPTELEVLGRRLRITLPQGLRAPGVEEF